MQIQNLWPNVTFDVVVVDYFRTPSAWAAKRWTDSFFSRTIPALTSVLKHGGRIYLPNYANHACNNTLQRVEQYVRHTKLFTIDLVPGDLNPLYVATTMVKDKIVTELGLEYTNELQVKSSSLDEKVPFIQLTFEETGN